MNTDKRLKIQIIIGTTREKRFSEKAASFIYQQTQKKNEIDVELVDLRDYPLPFFNEPVSPSTFVGTDQGYTNEQVKKWVRKIAQADGYIIVTAEYNHGYPAVLKNALDYVFKEWNKKSIGFVGYGSAGGARAIEQLKQVAIELQMVPIRSSIHIPSSVYLAAMNEKLPVNLELFKPLLTPVDRVDSFLNELIWMTKTLKTASEETK